MLLDQGSNQEGLHIFLIPLKFVIRLGKKIFVDITVFLIKKVTQLLKLQKCLMEKLDF